MVRWSLCTWHEDRAQWAAASGLDVERLARALCEDEDIDQQNDYGDFANLTTARKYAAAIAAEYARLAAQEEGA